MGLSAGLASSWLGAAPCEPTSRQHSCWDMPAGVAPWHPLGAMHGLLEAALRGPFSHLQEQMRLSLGPRACSPLGFQRTRAWMCVRVAPGRRLGYSGEGVIQGPTCDPAGSPQSWLPMLKAARRGHPQSHGWTDTPLAAAVHSSLLQQAVLLAEARSPARHGPTSPSRPGHPLE